MTRAIATFWSHEADWELFEPDGGVPGAWHVRREYRDLLERLCAAQRGNRVTLRRLAQQRRFGLAPDDSDRQIVAALAALLTRGLLRLDEHPRRLAGAWPQRPTVFDEPSVPLRTLVVDPQQPYETGWVAFILVDEGGLPLRAHHDCAIDVERREGRYGGAVVDYRPIRRNARVSLTMDDVCWPSDDASAQAGAGAGADTMDGEGVVAPVPPPGLEGGDTAEPVRPSDLPDPSIDTPSIVVFDTGGLCFASDREIFVPTRIDGPSADVNYHHLTGIDAIREVVEHARAHPGQRACVVGHADSVGTAASNVGLSQRRAQTVHLFLAGERAAWSALAVEHQCVADWQAFLQWAHLVMGMNCDPGEIDDDLGEQTQAAMHRFRASYNARHDGHLAIEGPFVADDWCAAFDCYRKNLAEQLGESWASIGAVLDTLRFGEPPILACGEAYPAEFPGVDRRASARNRRVDVIFYDAAALPALGGAPTPAAIYGDDVCRRSYGTIVCSRFAMVRLCLQDEGGAPQAGLACRLALGEASHEATSGADGYVEFRVPAEARDATLWVQAPNGRGQERQLVLGGLRPVHDEVGVEARLRNLGFDTGPALGQPDAVAAALAGFQRRCAIESTGSADDDTRARLAREHGC
ncbi:MAG: OmpA family protein [Deltaproteobacteria bacterium]|nr:OmpA family protein [Deltaproteobacteria bacterium]